MRKKAFWEYQWKEIRIAVLVLGIVLVCGVLSMLAVSEEIFFYDYDVASTSLLYLGNVARGGKIFSYAAWCMGGVFAFLLFGMYGDTGKMELFRSLPYTRRGTWWRSYLMGSGILTIGYVIFAIVAAILYFCYWPTAHDAYLQTPAYEILCSLDTLGNAWMFLLEEWIITLGVFSIAVFARMAMGHLISALLVLAGLLTAPSLLLINVGRQIISRDNKLAHGNTELLDGIQYWADWLLISRAHAERELFYYTSYFYYDVDSASGVVSVKYDTYEWSTIFLWMGMVVLATIFAYQMGKKETAYSVVGRTPFMENLFIFFAGLYLAMLLMFSMSGGISKSLPVLVAVFIVAEGIMIQLFKRKRQEKYEKWNTWKGGAYGR